MSEDKRLTLLLKKVWRCLPGLFFILVGGGIFLYMLCFSYRLLINQLISGSDFVALAIGFAVIGLVIATARWVSEFSFAGNIVKFRQVKKEVEEAVDSLQYSRIERYDLCLIQCFLH